MFIYTFVLADLVYTVQLILFYQLFACLYRKCYQKMFSTDFRKEECITSAIYRK